MTLRLHLSSCASQEVEDFDLQRGCPIADPLRHSSSGELHKSSPVGQFSDDVVTFSRL